MPAIVLTPGIVQATSSVSRRRSGPSSPPEENAFCAAWSASSSAEARARSISAADD
ncbi:MAG TPA: hypothetical protein VD931_19115 [Baekduia sp.]|nr:hypothetical protein [Baekduia sp.]